MPTKSPKTPHSASVFWRAAWLPLIWSLAGCATTSPASTPVAAPTIPQPPASLMTPPEPESFLERARADIEAWRNRLMGSETK